MKSIFLIFRLPLFPIPILVWTVIWPVSVLATYILIPIDLVMTAIVRCLGFPFVFLYSAINEDTDSLSQYILNWKNSNNKTIKELQVPILSSYKTIIGWLESPKSNGGSETVILYNVIGVAVIVVLVSWVNS